MIEAWPLRGFGSVEYSKARTRTQEVGFRPPAQILTVECSGGTVALSIDQIRVLSLQYAAGSGPKEPVRPKNNQGRRLKARPKRMYVCWNCLDRNWRYSFPEKGTVRATCKKCGNVEEFAAKQRKCPPKEKYVGEPPPSVTGASCGQRPPRDGINPWDD